MTTQFWCLFRKGGKMKKTVWVLTLLCCGTLVSDTTYTDSEARRVLESLTLSGLNGVYVEVISIKPEVEKTGLTQILIKTDVELRLQKYGIKVLTHTEWGLEDGTPRLLINPIVLITDVNNLYAYAYSLTAKFQQTTWLGRNLKICASSATTWQTGRVGIGPIANLKTNIRKTIADVVDEFIVDYLIAQDTNIDEQWEMLKEIYDYPIPIPMKKESK